MTEKEQKRKEYLKAYYQANKDKRKAQAKASAENNKDKIKEYQKQYQKTYQNDNIKEYQKEYREKNKQKAKLYNKQYNIINKDKLNKQRYEYLKNRLKTDSFFKLTSNVRNLVRDSLKYLGGKKLTKTEMILGCSFDAFRKHLESQFDSWMTWDNYGNWNGIPTEPNTSWDIDHIIPNSKATTQDELLKLNHYTNLRPMCSYTNRWIKRNNPT